MGVVKEFKEFAMKGNVVDLAVGVIIGAAFGKIVASVVEDLIMPVVGRVMPAGSNWQTYDFHGIKIGHFGGTVLDFLIIAICIFLIVKGINAMKKKEEPAPAPGPTTTEQLLMEIRDQLKK